MENWLSELIQGLLPNLLIIAAGYFMKASNQKIGKKDPRIIPATFFLFCFVWLIIVVFLMKPVIIISETHNSWQRLLGVSISTIIFFIFIWNEKSQFRKIGVTGADKSIGKGIGFEKALKLCNSQFSFLGIGAYKITNASGFEDAMLRCRSEKPIRFLLLDPLDEHLKIAAKKADKHQGKYHALAIESLKKIKKLKVERELNIQVRFYSGKPNLRLLFVDDLLCSLSGYTIFGADDGSDAPQIHFKNSRRNNRSSTFYQSFELLFNQRWKESKKWDFEEHITNE